MCEFTKDDVSALVDLVQQAIGMMEPYYSQCGAGDRILEELAHFEARLPYTKRIKPWQLGCPECGKHFHDATGTAQHLHARHPEKWSRRRADAEMKERDKTWPTKAAYQAEFES